MTDTLAAALSALQGELPPITKRKTAEIESQRTGKTHRYKYAELADVNAAVMPLLSKHGLAFIARPTVTEHGFVLAYSLLHASGERVDGEYPLPSAGDSQALGKAITYARKYALGAVTGVATEDDTDGKGSGRTTVQRGTVPRNADGSISRSHTTDEQKNAAGVMTGAQHAEHTRLQNGASRGRVPGTKRTSGPVPDEENPWQRPGLLPEEMPGSATKKQLDGLHASFTALGITRDERDFRLQITEAIIGRELTGPNEGRTSSNLAYTEAAKVKRQLSDWDNRAEAVAYMAEVMAT